MTEERISRILPSLFKQVEIPGQAKEKLRRRLFAKEELTDEQLSFVAAAGDIKEQAAQRQKQENGETEHEANG